MRVKDSPGGLLLSEHVQDVLHQQVPLQAVDPVAIQHHLVPARGAAEASAAGARAGGAAGTPQRVGCLEEERG